MLATIIDQFGGSSLLAHHTSCTAAGDIDNKKWLLLFSHISNSCYDQKIYFKEIMAFDFLVFSPDRV